jgi:membrane protein implicated in regulation of membrane protease activity
MELLANFGPFHWWALAAILVGIEMIMPTQYLLWPGLSAVMTGVALLFAPEMAWPWQALIFAFVGAGFALMAHYWPNGSDQIEPNVKLNQRAGSYIGRQAIVAEDFAGARGVVILDDTRWQAQTVDGRSLPSRTVVEITGAEGTVLKIKPVG